MSQTIVGRDWYKSKVALFIEWDVSKANNAASTNTLSDGEHWLSLPNRFSSNISRDFEKIHGFGVNEFNAGAVRKISQYSLSITLPAVSKSVRILRALMVARQPFSITSTEAQELDSNLPKVTSDIVAKDYEILAESFHNCYVQSMDTGYEIAEVPTITFEMMALRYSHQQMIGDDTLTNTLAVYGNTLGDGIVGIVNPLGGTGSSMWDDPWGEMN